VKGTGGKNGFLKNNPTHSRIPPPELLFNSYKIFYINELGIVFEKPPDLSEDFSITN
jgi:hypothetical protein